METVDIAVEVLAPGVAVAVLVAAVKTAVPGLQNRVLPLLAIVLGLAYAVTAEATAGLASVSDPTAVILLGISVGAEASGLQGWIRSQPEASAVIDSVPGTRPT
tara:strand:+ start:824 stop:1135 length:312 start_codon:yes stop_codon:yes gene_type:complete